MVSPRPASYARSCRLPLRPIRTAL
jgi:hypothetical protein